MDDVLSAVLRQIRLKSCVYFLRDFRAPWAMRIAGCGFAQFHVAVRGGGIVEAGGATQRFESGDLLLFPRGLPHVLADQPGREAVDGQALLASLNGSAPLFAEGGAATRLLCGHFEYDAGSRHPLIEDLPETLHIESLEQGASSLLDSVLPALIREIQTSRPGAETVVERLAEVLLIQALRAHFAGQPDARGFLAGAADPQVARAIRVIHSDWARRLTLDDLATAAGMSRSAFALHFKAVMAASPIAYLTKWRMLQARDLLRGSDRSVAQIALAVGYESEVAFSRAFKRSVALSPAAFRRAVCQEDAALDN